jgi:outer membrane protein
MALSLFSLKGGSMRKLLVLFFIFTLGSYAYAVDTKIAFVDLQRVFNDCEAGKATKAAWEDMVLQRQSVVEMKQKEKERLQAEFNKQSMMLSDDARRQKLDQMDKLQRDIQRMIDDFDTEMQQFQRDKEIAMINDLDAIIGTIGDENKFSIILRAEIVIYSAEGIDITDLVIEKYDAAFKKSLK